MKKKFRIVHIIGECNQYSFNLKNSKNYVQKKFTNEIAALIQNCDLVISRSGAGTINELIETEKPSILIPFPYSKNNHQEKNALILAESGGSVLMNQNKISKEVFEETLERIFKIKSKNGINNYEILDLMKNNMKNNNKLKSKSIIVIGDDEAVNGEFIIRLFDQSGNGNEEEVISFENDIKLENWINNNLRVK